VQDRENDGKIIYVRLDQSRSSTLIPESLIQLVTPCTALPPVLQERNVSSPFHSLSSLSSLLSFRSDCIPPFNHRVQHIISSHLINGTRYPESQILSIFHGTCLALRAMHQHVSGPSALPHPSSSSSSQPASKSMKASKGKGKQPAYPPQESDFSLEEEDEDEAEETVEGQALIGGLDAERERLREDEGVEGMGDQDGAVLLGRLESSAASKNGSAAAGGEEGFSPWAHRDIKPVSFVTFHSFPLTFFSPSTR